VTDDKQGNEVCPTQEQMFDAPKDNTLCNIM
jgi:hypothetical protein